MKRTRKFNIKIWGPLLFFIILLCMFQVKGEQFQYYGSLLSPHSTLVVSVVISPDQSFIVTGASQNTLKIWDYNSLALLSSHTYADIVTNVNIHPTNNKIYVSIFNGVVSILNGTTFSQISSYNYPNSGNAYSIVFPKYQNYYYAGGYDFTVPKIHKFDISTNLQSGVEVSTSFVSGNEIEVMDVFDDSSTHALLTIVSNQNASPFRMIVYNIGTGSSSNFNQATSDLTYTKFSPSGTYIFTSSADNKVRMYKYNNNTLNYQFKYFYSTALYGSPFGITAQSDQYINVAVGQYIVMLQIVDDKFQYVDSFHAGSSDIFSLYQLNGMIVTGENNGNVKLVRVSYPEDRSWKIRTIIIVGVVIFVVIAAISTIIGVFCIRKQTKIQLQPNRPNGQMVFNSNSNSNINMNNVINIQQNNQTPQLKNNNTLNQRKKPHQIDNLNFNNIQNNQLSWETSQIHIS